MNKIVLRSLEGITIEGLFSKKIIKLYSNESNILNEIGKPFDILEDDDGKIYYYDNNSIQLNFDNKGKLEYIEISHDSSYKVFFENYEVFKIPAEELVKKIDEKYKYNREDRELGYSYEFLEIELALWRPSIPEKMEGDLGENDFQKGIYFSTIGIGIKGYFK